MIAHTLGVTVSEILEHSNDAFIAMDRQWRVLYLNAAAARLTPIAREKLVGQILWEAFPEMLGTSFDEAYHRAIAEDQPVEFEAHWQRAGRWFHVRAHPAPSGLGAWMHDITERRLVRQSLHESERNFRFLADMIPAQVWTARPDGMLDYVNQRVLDYFGKALEQMLGDGWRDVVHPEDMAITAARWSHCLATGEPYEHEFRLRHHDGSYRWHIARAASMRGADGVIQRWFGTNSDVTELKTAEAALREQKTVIEALNAQLEQRVKDRTAELQVVNDRLEVSNRELQDFASVASHDLQEPLRKIQAFGDRLSQKAADLGDEGRDYVARMQKAASRMQRLINDLLVFSRVATRAQPYEPVDLRRIAEEVLSDLETRVQQSGGKVIVGELPTIDADPMQMRQLLQNLLANALKFSAPTVNPVVRLTSATVVEERRRAGGENGETDPVEMIELAVQDNGIGFDEKYLDRIFNVFQRLHGRGHYEGTGIGLAVCRRIAERHGGSITAQSRPGEGSTFLVRLPLRQITTDAIVQQQAALVSPA